MKEGQAVRISDPGRPFDLREGVIVKIRDCEYTRVLVFDVLLAGEREPRPFSFDNLRAMKSA